eukprot:jgi/Botrbrau1/5403/Bobra.182_1s0007.1
MGGGSPKFSSRLKDLELENEIEEQQLQSALAGGTLTQPPPEVSIVSPSRTRVADGSDERDTESLLKRRQAPQAPPPVEQKKMFLIIAATTCFAIFLLWLLFRGNPIEIDETFDFAAPPKTGSELQASQPDHPCPHWRWLPPPCIADDRLKSKSIFDKCQQWFDKYGYSVELLRSCKIID